MGSAGLVIRYDVVGYVGEGGQISGKSGWRPLGRSFSPFW